MCVKEILPGHDEHGLDGTQAVVIVRLLAQLLTSSPIYVCVCISIYLHVCERDHVTHPAMTSTDLTARRP
jgi:hypothetical protein